MFVGEVVLVYVREVVLLSVGEVVLMLVSIREVVVFIGDV